MSKRHRKHASNSWNLRDTWKGLGVTPNSSCVSNLTNWDKRSMSSNAKNPPGEDSYGENRASLRVNEKRLNNSPDRRRPVRHPDEALPGPEEDRAPGSFLHGKNQPSGTLPEPFIDRRRCQHPGDHRRTGGLSSRGERLGSLVWRGVAHLYPKNQTPRRVARRQSGGEGRQPPVADGETDR